MRRIFSAAAAVMYLAIAAVCLAGCGYGNAFEDKPVSEEEMIIRVQSVLPGCEYVRTEESGRHVFARPDGIEFSVYETVIEVMGRKQTTLQSNYFHAVLRHHNDQILAMSTQSVTIDTAFLYGDIAIYIDSRDSLQEAADIFCSIDDLCQFEVLGQHGDVIMDGQPAVHCMHALVVFFCKDSTTGEYDNFSQAMHLSCNSEERKSRADMAEWLAEQYSAKFDDNQL